ncbi:MAG TPA: gephyrin-like molybdotransferase Glp [Anaerolineae bacterium]|nr:gephyrin-like molybdotransferase Glp [Anaerolineae bacterium]
MPELFTVLTPPAALRKLLDHLPAPLPIESIPILAALDRVIAESPLAPGPLPAFARSTMDGYAVRAADTFGASETLPTYLTVIGEAPMGQAPAFEIGRGQAAIIHTGGMLPKGGDAVVMIERTQVARENEIEVLRSVAVGENVIQIGEDIQAGEALLPIGHRLRPQDLGGLAATGITRVSVAQRPRVAILATGDEVVPADAEPAPGQVRDVNTYTVAGLVERAGGVPLPRGIAPDDLEALYHAARAALDASDALVLSAGSSVSVRDMTSGVIARLGQPGVLVHGVSLKPGKPTILAVCEGKPVFGLPGNPVSAMVVADLFLTPTVWHLQGLAHPAQPRSIQARLGRNVASTPGREDYIQVKLLERDGEVWAEPIFGKSNLIYTLVKADGLLVVPLDANGVQAGERVEVRVF